MLCVTMAMVKSCFSSSISSSIFSVLIGSSALVGSSSRITSGRTAMVRAMQSRCCWPPDRPMAEVCSRSFTSSHSAPRVSDHSTRSSISALDSFSCSFTPNAMFS